MLLYKTIDGIKRFLHLQRSAGKTVGFVPTMGALHAGHISLLKKCLQENDVTVCSIFVNPTQFNNLTDLEKYPRPVAKDIEMLLDAGNQVLFLPEVQEMYPQNDINTKKINLNGLDATLEGKYRHGHFDGVVQVVKRLLDIVNPHRLYLGQKDYQQYLVISQMVKQFKLPVDVILCETIREADGLAMSSRNTRLNENARITALNLSKVLFEVKQRLKHEQNVVEVKQWALRELEKNNRILVDYFDIVDAETLDPIKNFNGQNKVIACVAATIDKVRLIDNIIIS